MKRNLNTKKMVINALLLAIGAILHQITPALGLPMQPDFALAMLFIIMIINNNDYSYFCYNNRNIHSFNYKVSWWTIAKYNR